MANATGQIPSPSSVSTPHRRTGRVVIIQIPPIALPAINIGDIRIDVDAHGVELNDAQQQQPPPIQRAVAQNLFSTPPCMV